jgi:Tol biopolymer transport system component
VTRRVLSVLGGGYFVVVLSGVALASFAVSPRAQLGADGDIEIKLTEGTMFAAVASPDRRSIAIDLLGALWVLPINGGNATRITPDTIEARLPTWSPDSRSLAFQGYDESWHIYTITAEGTALKALTSGPFDDREPDWSRDGRRIAFSSDRAGGISSIWQVDVGTGATRQLSQYIGNDPCWSLSDRDVLFWGRPAAATRSSWLWRKSPDGPEEEGVSGPVTGPGVIVPLQTLCGNGRTFWYGSSNGFATVGPRVRDGEDPFPFQPQLLNATEFLYTADGHIKRWTPPGNSSTLIPFTATLKLNRPSYQRVHRDLQPQTPQPVRGIVNPAVSPDGTRIAFTAVGDLWLLPIGQQPIQLTNDPFVEIDPAWSRDGTRLAYASDRGGNMDVWIRNFRTGTEAQLTREKGPVSGVAWSPDGQDIAFLVNRGDLRIVSVATGALRPSRPSILPSGERGRPTWPADGRRVAVGALFPSAAPFGAGTNQWLLRSIDTGSESAATLVLHHSAGNRVNNGPVWSPDGFRVTYVTEGRLWVVGVATNGVPHGDPSFLTDDLPDSPSWEGDSRHIVYLTTDGLRRVSADGGTPEPIALGLAWQPVLPRRMLVHAGAVFDGRNQELRRNVDIVIDRGRIQAIDPHGDDRHTGTVIDASTETVMPGLIDMHAHLDSGYGQALGRILLAYGITSVRDPEANAFAGLEQRESYDAERRIGPRLFIAGDPFGGMRVFEAGGVSIASELQLLRELERAARLGYDFFSTYIRLPGKYLRPAIAFAHANGRPVTSQELYPAVAFGADGVEGLRDISRRGFPSRVSTRNVSYRDVIDLIARTGTALTPMIGRESGLPAFTGFGLKTVQDPSWLSDPRFGLFPASSVDGYRDRAEFMRSRPDEMGRAGTTLRSYKTTIAAIVAGGGSIVAGSGAPDVPYGLGLHAELEELVEAGLTPFQALRTATANAAEALGAADQLGTLEPGKLADMVIVGGDPLQDIKNARDVRGVLRGGRHYDLPALLRR